MHDIIEIEKRYEKARKLVGALASGKERWNMSIPVERERDTDMVLADSLDDVPKLIQMLYEARAKSARDEPGYFYDHPVGAAVSK